MHTKQLSQNTLKQVPRYIFLAAHVLEIKKNRFVNMMTSRVGTKHKLRGKGTFIGSGMDIEWKENRNKMETACLLYPFAKCKIL